MDVVFQKSDDGRQCTWVVHIPKRRPIVGSTMNVGTKRPPHDLVQLAVEAGLRVERGFWGTIAAGGRFRSMPVVRTQPSRNVIRTRRAELDDAEHVAGRHYCAWVAGQPTPAGPVLERLVTAWWALPNNEQLVVHWPSGALVEVRRNAPTR